MKTAVVLTFISLAAITAPAAGQDARKAADAAVSAAVSRLDNHDREIAALKSRVAALEAQPRATQPAPAAAVPLGSAVSYAGRSLAGGVLQGSEVTARDAETYAYARQLVASGLRVTLFVGVPATEYSARTVVVLRVDRLPDGDPAGVYDCFRGSDGRAMFERRPDAPTATAPTFSAPIRNAIYNLAAPSGCANGQCPTPRRR